ncbi:MAG TPA: hypothetical protein VM388_01265 [Acidimicrobiales bacterium]|nr:hypothetical protein [Acidimicrobiales bacterium]
MSTRRSDRYAGLVDALGAAVLSSAGVTTPEARAAVAGGGAPSDALAPFLAKVRDPSSGMAERDIAALRDAGHAEEEIFELTVAAALGAALQRYERAVGLLGGDG